ncbi:anti-sigma regulatory factor (Ser/Thr protein kinase) [Streptomyces sp. B3I7]|uniref:ATP-binding protein n=1 Tax=Streptomyces sp. B3I7 TaxID=3042269 RepID=UPI00277FE9C9|nr:ATP-binding protein [Streptomyces sp. B3I7]MDQ0808612.1 anti-sigma regulatory factor (Ser/Thr protein kinase) [Streptomyces sp. B3I7]
MRTTLTIIGTPPPGAGGEDRPPPAARVTGAARAHVTARLGQWRARELVDAATLVTSELVTNGIRHGRAPVLLDLYLLRGARGGPDRLRIAVSDGGPGFDLGTVRAGWNRDDGLEEGGRGLRLTEALAECWGNHVDDGLHVVWACLPLPRPT